jgi:hypothetical protein
MQLGSHWGIDMNTPMFGRDIVRTFLDAEINTFRVDKLSWKNNALANRADGFIPLDKRDAEMIKGWHQGEDKYLEKLDLKPGQTVDTYKWLEKSNAPPVLKRQTHTELPGTSKADTFEAKMADFFNTVSDKSYFDTHTGSFYTSFPDRHPLRAVQNLYYDGSA